MIADQNTHPTLREDLVKEIDNVFGDYQIFLDYIEEEMYGANFDCFARSDDESYIINRNTGEYINWYKFYHIGRDVHISYNDKLDINKFLTEFKNDHQCDSDEWNMWLMQHSNKPKNQELELDQSAFSGGFTHSIYGKTK